MNRSAVFGRSLQQTLLDSAGSNCDTTQAVCIPQVACVSSAKQEGAHTIAPSRAQHLTAYGQTQLRKRTVLQ